MNAQCNFTGKRSRERPAYDRSLPFDRLSPTTSVPLFLFSTLPRPCFTPYVTSVIIEGSRWDVIKFIESFMFFLARWNWLNLNSEFIFREHSRVIVRIIHRIQDRNIVTIYSKQFLISISNIQIFFLLNSFLLLLLFLHADFGISIFGYISQQRLKRTEIFIAVCETITLTA